MNYNLSTSRVHTYTQREREREVGACARCPHTRVPVVRHLAVLPLQQSIALFRSVVAAAATLSISRAGREHFHELAVSTRRASFLGHVRKALSPFLSKFVPILSNEELKRN